jgi:hypothetical protein
VVELSPKLFKQVFEKTLQVLFFCFGLLLQAYHSLQDGLHLLLQNFKLSVATLLVASALNLEVDLLSHSFKLQFGVRYIVAGVLGCSCSFSDKALVAEALATLETEKLAVLIVRRAYIYTLLFFLLRNFHPNVI